MPLAEVAKNSSSMSLKHFTDLLLLLLYVIIIIINNNILNIILAIISTLYLWI